MLAQQSSSASQAGEDRYSRACHGVHGKTASRIERLCQLVTALQGREMMREDMADLLAVGPSAVRKYIKDLGEVITIARFVDGSEAFVGFPVYRLAMSVEQANDYVASLESAPAARKVRASLSALSIAAQDPSRHFHILQDDAHYSIRVSRAPVSRDPLVAALFGTRGGMEARA